ncbi:MAG: preprotein translocase subunit SecG [bacterium]|nr:MAG: preprotein translocase subunit SecG [bacterium]
MVSIILGLHVTVALMMIVIVLLQSGSKGASLGAAFGGSSQTVFGSRGPASFLGKITTFAAIVFMLTSLTLSIVSSRMGGATVVDDIVTEPLPQAVEESSSQPGAIDPFKTPDDVDVDSKK